MNIDKIESKILTGMLDRKELEKIIKLIVSKKTIKDEKKRNLLMEIVSVQEVDEELSEVISSSGILNEDLLSTARAANMYYNKSQLLKILKDRGFNIGEKYIYYKRYDSGHRDDSGNLFEIFQIGKVNPNVPDYILCKGYTEIDNISSIFIFIGKTIGGVGKEYVSIRLFDMNNCGDNISVSNRDRNIGSGISKYIFMSYKIIDEVKYSDVPIGRLIDILNRDDFKKFPDSDKLNILSLILYSQKIDNDVIDLVSARLSEENIFLDIKDWIKYLTNRNMNLHKRKIVNLLKKNGFLIKNGKLYFYSVEVDSRRGGWIDARACNPNNKEEFIRYSIELNDLRTVAIDELPVGTIGIFSRDYKNYKEVRRR